eukprot:5656219-Pyramimonas_sp.AAC.1
MASTAAAGEPLRHSGGHPPGPSGGGRAAPHHGQPAAAPGRLRSPVLSSSGCHPRSAPLQWKRGRS